MGRRRGGCPPGGAPDRACDQMAGTAIGPARGLAMNRWDPKVESTGVCVLEEAVAAGLRVTGLPLCRSRLISSWEIARWCWEGCYALIVLGRRGVATAVPSPGRWAARWLVARTVRSSSSACRMKVSPGPSLEGWWSAPMYAGPDSRSRLRFPRLPSAAMPVLRRFWRGAEGNRLTMTLESPRPCGCVVRPFRTWRSGSGSLPSRLDRPL